MAVPNAAHRAALKVMIRLLAKNGALGIGVLRTTRDPVRSHQEDPNPASKGQGRVPLLQPVRDT